MTFNLRLPLDQLDELGESLIAAINNRIDTLVTKLDSTALNIKTYNPYKDVNPYPAQAFDTIFGMFENNKLVSVDPHKQITTIFDIVPRELVPLFNNQYKVQALDNHDCNFSSNHGYFIAEFIDNSLQAQMYTRLSCNEISSNEPKMLALALLCVDNENEVTSIANPGNISSCTVTKNICGNNIFIIDGNNTIPFSSHKIICGHSNIITYLPEENYAHSEL